MNWELIGKFGGSEIQVHPVHVAYIMSGSDYDREVLKVHGEPGSQYLITIVGHYENGSTSGDYQLRWRTESSDSGQMDPSSRGGQAQVAVLAQGGDTLTVGGAGGFAASFIGKAYVAPIPEISEDAGSITSFPVGPMKVAGSQDTEHLVADLEVPPGEVWKVKVTGTYTWSSYIGDSNSPSIMVGAKQSSLANKGNAVEIEAYVSTVSRISLVTDDSYEVTFEGVVEIAPMKW